MCAGYYRKYILPILVVAIGLLATAIVFFGLIRQQQEKIQRDFARTAGDRSEALARRLDDDFLIPENIEMLFKASTTVTENEFYTFAEAIRKRKPEVMNLGWATTIPSGNGGFLHRIQYLSGQADLNLNKGRSLEETPGMTRALREAMEKKAPTSLHIATTNAASQPQSQWMIVLPLTGISEASEDQEPTRGVVIARVDLPMLLEAILKDLSRVGMDVELYDGDRIAENLLTMRYSVTRNAPYDSKKEQSAEKYVFVKKVKVGEGEWTVYCRPAPLFLAKYNLLEAWLVLAGGVASSLLGGSLLLRKNLAADALHLQNRRIKILQQVAVAANKSSTDADLLEESLRLVTEYLAGSFGHVYLRDEMKPDQFISSGIFSIGDEKNWEVALQETESTQFHRGGGVIGHIWETGVPFYDRRLDLNPSFLRTRMLREYDLHTMVAFPVFVRQEATAVFEIFHRESYQLPPGWSDLMKSMGTQIGQALERRLAATELQEKNTVLENAVEGIAHLDGNGYLLSANPAYLLLCEKTAEELIGQKGQQGMAEEDVAAYQTAFVEALVEGKSNVQVSCLRGDGTVAFHELTMVRDEDHHNQLRGVYQFVRDVTADRNAEREIIAARDTAMESARFKSQFLANMSHEIRTPMNGLIGMLGLLNKTKMEDSQRDLLHTAQSSSDSLLRLLNDILDFSKIEAGKMELDAIVFDPRQCVRHAVKILVQSAAQKGLQLTQSVGENVPPLLLGDSGRLTQIIVNLVNNSIKFTPSGSVAVTLEVERRITDQLIELHCAVCDTGIGIPAEHREHVFQAFRQSDNSTARKYGGTGLGLAICTQLTELMGGKIWMEPRSKGGSIFHFTVQMEECRGAVLPLVVPVTVGVRAEKPLRILLAEDNEVNQRIAVALLEERGHHISLANTGQDAVDLFGSGDFDLILMDVQMPGKDGYQATHEIRAGERGKSIPIYALTAHALPEDRRKCLETGMNGYLTKPINVTEFARLIEGKVNHDGVVPLTKKVSEASPINEVETREPGLRTSHLKTFDLAALRARVNNNDGFILELAASFHQQATEDRAGIQRALATNNAELLIKSAHRLRGSAGSLSAEALAESAHFLEMAGRSGNLENARLEWDHFESIFAASVEELTSLNDTLSASKLPDLT